MQQKLKKKKPTGLCISPLRKSYPVMNSIPKYKAIHPHLQIRNKNCS